MEWQLVAATLGGLVGQWFKTYQRIPTWIPQLSMLVIGAGVYMIYNPPHVTGLALARYVLEAILTGASVNGVASLVGLHPSLKTDVR